MYVSILQWRLAAHIVVAWDIELETAPSLRLLRVKKLGRLAERTIWLQAEQIGRSTNHDRVYKYVQIANTENIYISFIIISSFTLHLQIKFLSA